MGFDGLAVIGSEESFITIPSMQEVGGGGPSSLVPNSIWSWTDRHGEFGVDVSGDDNPSYRLGRR